PASRRIFQLVGDLTLPEPGHIFPQAASASATTALLSARGANMKIGEILIQRGLINKAQLKEALDAQLIFGGNLGTCLMELGYLSERRLGAVLAEIFDVEYAPPEYFDNIPRFVTSALNARLVERHQ